ncbi:hypothetical protein GCK72_026020 [Caenorhabditis remanei]|uniref:Uncharacterized protein n=1 Tax=Caenorhabditis remanei TaxID=31234 RepID=A0A6A5G4D7_CAERE|nr:hypothetical protein GCK72_026020 [Caenorhabditis remanei]KAF1749552.1 hypothetical protein GCK72_026020 [Caenorhabditis remanei]
MIIYSKALSSSLFTTKVNMFLRRVAVAVIPSVMRETTISLFFAACLSGFIKSVTFNLQKESVCKNEALKKVVFEKFVETNFELLDLKKIQVLPGVLLQNAHSARWISLGLLDGENGVRLGSLEFEVLCSSEQVKVGGCHLELELLVVLPKIEFDSRGVFQDPRHFFAVDAVFGVLRGSALIT